LAEVISYSLWARDKIASLFLENGRAASRVMALIVAAIGSVRLKPFAPGWRAQGLP
jgi:hypothetical protein